MIQNGIKGRGIASNAASRYLSRRSEPVDDGWFNEPEDDASRPATELFTDNSKTILTRNKSPDIPFDVSINPYKRCEHGCAYCYARPTHSG